MPSFWGKLASWNEKLYLASESRTNTAPLPALLKRSPKHVDQVVRRDAPFLLSDLPAYIDAVKNMNGVGLDDRKFLLENVLVLMSRLPPSSTFSGKLQQFVIELLYKDLPHPPASYLTPPSNQRAIAPRKNVKYAYRTADGSDYNILFPSMGRAGTPYARSVPSLNNTPKLQLPDSGLVFDTLLRRDGFEAHPGGISNLFFAFANLITHTVFSTDHGDWTINDASSYLDLSVLYGSSEKQVDSVRRKDGTGRLWDDVFADSRLLFTPPSTGALLVIFNRNHNYIADKILNINEARSFQNPPPADDGARIAQDDEIFHRARLVNCGFFMQVILRDYVGSILGLIRDGYAWRLDPLQFARELHHEDLPRGEGNTVSIEFNLLYRWHAAISVQDEKWTEGLFEKLFEGKSFDQVTPQDFQAAAHKYLIPDPDVKKWSFGGLARDNKGRFGDADIASIIQGATESSASAFKARGIPSVLRVIEIMGIEQARSWGACSLNEFRKFIGLKPYTSFDEWNPNPDINSAAATLYHHIDNLELYTGMQAEESKPPMPGAGLCPGYTISRAILADAVCLTRGDRFLTTELTPFNLTSWGYADCQADNNDGSFGGMLSRLLFRHLPEYYPTGSAYAHFPFMVPQRMKNYMEGQPGSPVRDYIWTKPVKQSEVSFETRLENITKAPLVDINAVLFSSEAVDDWCHSFRETTSRLIKHKSFIHAGSKANILDVVHDVINIVPVYWIAEDILGIPVKGTSSSPGLYLDQELYEMFSQVASYFNDKHDKSSDWALRGDSAKALELVHKAVSEGLPGSTFGCLSAFWNPTSHSHNKVLRNIFHFTGATLDSITASLFAEVVVTAPVYSKAVTLVVDYFLRDEMADLRKTLQVQSPANDAQIFEHIRDALGSGSNATGVKPGPSPGTNGHKLKSGAYGHLSSDFFERTTLQILRVIFSLPDMRRASGPTGQLTSFTDHVTSGVTQESYVDLHGAITPWPVSLIIQYD